MCSQSVSVQGPIKPGLIQIKEVPPSPLDRTPVKGGVPMPLGQSLQAQINANKPTVVKRWKDPNNSFKDVQAKRLQNLKGTPPKPEGTPLKTEGTPLKPEGTPLKTEGTPPKPEGIPPQPVRLKDGGIPQTGPGTETQTPEGKRLAQFKADYAKAMEGIGTLPAPNAKTAHVLLANAANAKGLLVDFLFERREKLGGDFAGLSKEQLADQMDRAPLARLSAADRMAVAELRSARQFCLDRLNVMVDGLDSAAVKDVMSERVETLGKYLATAESTVRDAIKALTRQNENSELARKLNNFLDTCLKGERLGDAPLDLLLDEMLNPFLDEMARDVPKDKLEQITKEVSERKQVYQEILGKVFTGIANLAGERALLQQGGGGVGVETTLRSFNLSRSAAWWDTLIIKHKSEKSNLEMFSNGMLLFHFSKTTGTVVPPQGFRSRNDYKDFSKEFSALGNGGNNLPPPPTVDGKLQALLQDLMPRKILGSRKSALHAAVWKFDQALRFNMGDRLLVGLSSNFSEQIHRYVKETPLSRPQKKILEQRLLEVAGKHFVQVPSGGKELTAGGQGAPRLVSLKPGEPPVLVKNFHETKGKPPAAVSALREMILQETGRDNPHIPKVIGIGVPQPGADGKVDVPPKLSLVMEAIPGKDLNSYLTIVDPIEDEKRDPLLTGLPAEDRGKVAAHLVAGGIRGLAPLHARGLAHMDVKPANIMLDKNSLEARLIDFGSACIPGAETTLTPGFVPPDSVLAGLPSDVYALGVSLMQLAMGTITKERPEAWGKNLEHEYWNENKKAQPLRDAARIMMDPVGANRPTLEQLLAILDGRPVPPKQEGKDGASPEAIATLKKVFDPKSEWAGGRDVLAGRMGSGETPPKKSTGTEV